MYFLDYQGLECDEDDREGNLCGKFIFKLDKFSSKYCLEYIHSGEEMDSNEFLWLQWKKNISIFIGYDLSLIIRLILILPDRKSTRFFTL